MKSDFEVMDTLIESLYGDLSDISYRWFEAQKALDLLKLQYELVKKEYEQLKKGEQE